MYVWKIYVQYVRINVKLMFIYKLHLEYLEIILCSPRVLSTLVSLIYAGTLNYSIPLLRVRFTINQSGLSKSLYCVVTTKQDRHVIILMQLRLFAHSEHVVHIVERLCWDRVVRTAYRRRPFYRESHYRVCNHMKRLSAEQITSKQQWTM